MKIATLLKGLTFIRTRFTTGKSRLLQDNASQIVHDAFQKAKSSYQNCEVSLKNPQNTSPTWTFEIKRDNPVVFVESREASPYHPIVDLSCKLVWSPKNKRMDEFHLVEQEILIRVCSNVKKHIYREKYDSNEFKDFLDNSKNFKRVMSRWHFDLANNDQNGPKHHLQYGGNPQDHEWCWHPEALNVPRIQHPPMELFLALDMVAANFHGEIYASIQQEPTWMGIIRECQDLLYTPYFQQITKAISDKKNVRKEMWNRK